MQCVKNKHMYSKGCNMNNLCTCAAADDNFPLRLRRPLCPNADACRNCMPKRDDSGDMQCWAIDKPVTYKLQRYGKVRRLLTKII